MTLEDKAHAFPLHVLQRGKELGSVSAACRETGISRTLYCRRKKRFTLYGSDRLHPPQYSSAPWSAGVTGLDRDRSGPAGPRAIPGHEISS
jgi:hypothetical protein